MAHSHYVMDLHYPEARDPERFKREVLRIEAHDDADAESEGRRIDSWRKPAFFVVRAIQKTAKGKERVIFDSRSEHEAHEAADTVIVAEAPGDKEAPAPQALEATAE